jgi:hypothetical protein
LFNCGETAIVAAVLVLSAPFVGIGCGRFDNQEQRHHQRDGDRQTAEVLVHTGPAE